MRILAPIFFLVILFAAIILGGPFFMFGKVVFPNELGVRVNFYGVPGVMTKGYQSDGLLPGLHWQIPHLSTVLTLPRDFQFVTFHDQTGERGNGDFKEQELEVPTTDGSKVRSDVTMVFRLYEKPNENRSGEEGEQGGPKKLIENYTDSREKILKRFSEVAKDQLKRALSTLSTTEFYNPERREEASQHANKAIGKIVGEVGIELWNTLIHRFTYADQKIDDQIFAKNLQDQTERLNAASSKLTAAKAETEKQSALWDAKIRDLEVDGESKVKVTRSEGELYETKKKGEGDLFVTSVRAEVDAERAKVLSESAGSQAYIARELAPLLETLRGGVITGVDPYDINSWTEKLSGESK
jgi:hypothetical protein